MSAAEGRWRKLLRPGPRGIESCLRDLGVAARMLRRSPSFAVVAIASMTLGFALMASTVAVVNAYLLRSLPYAAAERLYHLRYAPPGPWEPRGMSGLDWTSVGDVVEFPITSASETYYLTDARFAQTLRALRVSSGFIAGLGVQPQIGRSLLIDDFAGAAEPSALISHLLWTEQYGADPQVVGRTLRLLSESATGGTATFRVVGVLPPEFYFGRDAEPVDLLLPLTRPARTYMVKLREGVPPAMAERRITEAARQAGTGIPADWDGVHLDSVHGRYAAAVQPVLTGVSMASALVLVIVAANVGTLLLLRTTRRAKEMAVRTALGASSFQLVRMLVLENALLCVAALAGGLLLTHIILGMLAPLVEEQLGRPAAGGENAIALDASVILIAGVIAGLTAAGLSLIAMLAPWRRRLAGGLRRDGHSGSDTPGSRRLRAGLVSFEVGGTLVLAIGCALLVQSVIGMLRTDLGFDAERLVRGRIVLRAAAYPDAHGFARFYEQFAQRLFESTRSRVVFANWPPFNDLPAQSVETEGNEGAGSPAGAIAVGAGYFTTMSIPLRSGREFAPSETMAGEPVAVISETLAARLWQGASALGRRLRIVEPTPAGLRAGPWRVVVGVARDVRQAYGDTALADVYIPFKPSDRFGSFYMRTDQPPSTLLNVMRSVASELDPHAVVGLPRAVASHNRELAGATFLTTMLSAFAGVAAFLGILGIYGVTAYAAQQRRREIAIRMAVGAAAGDVVRLFLKESASILLVGVIAGLLAAPAAARLLENRLYGVSAFDPVTVTACVLVLAGTGLVAAWWPARRAARSNPIIALKEG